MEQNVLHHCTIAMATLGLALFLTSCTGTGQTGGEKAMGVQPSIQDLGNGACLQQPEELMWQTGRSPLFKSWEEADTYVKTLDLAGYQDWRLPTPDECLKLSQLLQQKGGDCPMQPGGNHWVSKTENIEAGHWETSLYCDGALFHWTKDKKGRVKAVRP